MGDDSSVLRPEHPSARSLAELVNDFALETRGAVESVEVSGISINTGNLQPGDLYVGVQGVRSHGASYAAKAKELGAVALLTDAAGAELAVDAGLPAVIVESPSLGACTVCTCAASIW